MSVPLPPLPSVFVPDDAAHDPGGPNIVDLLAEQHRQLTLLCERLTDPGVDQQLRRETADVLTATLARHLSGEEQYLFPAVRAALPDGRELADAEIAEDRALLRTLRDLQRTAPPDPEFDRLAETLAGRLRRHVEAAATRLLPRLRASATREELVRLGNRVEIAEEAAPTRPHPDAPATPPWNKVVDPALGVVDKVRDVATGRRTSIADLP
ncbi:Hemerythrin HHE cation binding domain-containing protein [Micromonospora pattaloongensis]|uniref:Hemerythrin HHE cation binding domain-containing protein n=1 Tax=Micromonospora pattaloongensis TaxID=405436 RepID=A0A1H3PCV5_9ACTN|nr:hemerythrin domain-containing protein [Micromonospora pattaloongensis]SDY98956.1 Hemerythrin HHE cation binding domain-containing protein [Micromonospora pattaloongensis]